jgi:serine/threonine-protein kinase
VISPDGRWIAYESLETGDYEVYIRPFPNVEAGKWMISRGGGVDPVWSPNGRELFYYYNGNPSSVMAVPIETEPAFSAGSPVLLFTGDYIYAQGRHYDIHPDGQRFLMIKEAEQTADQLNVVLNWFEELKRLAPTE